MKKQVCPSLLVILIVTLIAQSHSKCYNYWKGDVLPTFTSNSYCSTSAIIQEIWSHGLFQLKLSVQTALEMLLHWHFISQFMQVITRVGLSQRIAWEFYSLLPALIPTPHVQTVQTPSRTFLLIQECLYLALWPGRD